MLATKAAASAVSAVVWRVANARQRGLAGERSGTAPTPAPAPAPPPTPEAASTTGSERPPLLGDSAGLPLDAAEPGTGRRAADGGDTLGLRLERL
jgi:hypothetical protein